MGLSSAECILHTRGRTAVPPIRLRPSERVVEADWLAPRLAPFGAGVSSVVPGGFDAYSRILHPARGKNDEAIRWADVAIKSGGIMHRLVQFHAINRSSLFGTEVEAPEAGNLPSDLLRVLCLNLAEHTSTPDSCWFCLWDGHGWTRETGISTVEFRANGPLTLESRALHSTTDSASLSSMLSSAVQSPTRVQLPNRNYLLFEGPLEAATEVGWIMPGGTFVPQSPNLFWPSDHAWCVASEIDLFCTLVAGSNALATELAGDPRLEVLHVLADDSISADSDKQNI